MTTLVRSYITYLKRTLKPIICCRKYSKIFNWRRYL